MAGPTWPRYHRHALISGVVTLVLIWGMMVAVLTVPQLKSPQAANIHAARWSFVEGTPLEAADDVALGIYPMTQPGAQPTRETLAEFQLALTDADSTQTLPVQVTAVRYGTWDLDAATREAEAERLAARYHRDLFGTFELEEIFPYRGGDITNPRQRPIDITVRFEEVGLLFFPPPVVRTVGDTAHTYSFPPLDSPVTE
jgi:hypothetical protein